LLPFQVSYELTCLRCLPHRHRSLVRRGTHPQARWSPHPHWLGMRSNSFVLSRPSLRRRALSAHSLWVSSAARALRRRRAIVRQRRQYRSYEPLSSHPSCRGREAIIPHLRAAMGPWRKSSLRDLRLARSVEKWPLFMGMAADVPCWCRRIFAALLLVFGAPSGQGQLAQAQESLLQGVFWGEPQSELLAHFGKRALVLQGLSISVIATRRSCSAMWYLEACH